MSNKSICILEYYAHFYMYNFVPSNSKQRARFNKFYHLVNMVIYTCKLYNHNIFKRIKVTIFLCNLILDFKLKNYCNDKSDLQI